MNFKRKILIAAGAVAMFGATSASAFVVVDYFAGGSYSLTADGGKIYTDSSNGGSNATFSATGPVGQVVDHFGPSTSRSWGADGGKLAAKSGQNLTLWDLATKTQIGSTIATGNSNNHGVAYDSAANRAYYGNGGGSVWWHDFDDNSSGALGNIGQAATIANGENESYFEDIEIAGGFLWAVDGRDSDIFKFALDGSYIGKETTNAGLHIEGFGFDEISNAFWGHSNYTPDFACSTCQGQTLGRAHYIQKLGGFTSVTTPGGGTVSEPATLALLGLGLLGFGLTKRKRRA